MNVMTNKADIREFLTTRRAKITPPQPHVVGRPIPPDSPSAERLDVLASWTAPARTISPAEDTSMP